MRVLCFTQIALEFRWMSLEMDHTATSRIPLFMDVLLLQRVIKYDWNVKNLIFHLPTRNLDLAGIEMR